MTTKYKGLDPTGEIPWVAHPQAESQDLLEVRHYCHRWELDVKHLRRPVQLVLEFRYLPVFCCPRESGPEGIFLYCKVGDPGEVQEGLIGGSEKCV